MVLIRFASLCDKAGCGERSPEYECWPHCENCGDDVCPKHQVSCTVVSDESRHSCVCTECHAEEE